MVKTQGRKNKIGKKERKGVCVCVVANLARVVREGTHQMRFEQRFQRVKRAHTVDIWRKIIPGRWKSECKGPEVSVYLS